MASFADVQFCIYADIGWLERVGGSEKVQNYADVIYEWSLIVWSVFLKPTSALFVSFANSRFSAPKNVQKNSLLKQFFLLESYGEIRVC